MELSAEQEAAFNGIIRRYYPGILKFCDYTLGGNRNAASLRRERARFAPSPAFDTGGGTASVDSIAADGRIKTDGERIAEEKALARAAVEIGRRLKPKDEQILDLAFRQKRPLKEVAARLNISLSAAKSRVSRLRQRVSALARELLAD
jgi:DNA-directed RNA polymerase specialized sigma24 family protein